MWKMAAVGSVFVGFLSQSAALVAADLPSVVAIRTYDYVGTPAKDLSVAKAEVDTILQEVGIQIEWIDCPIVSRNQPQPDRCRQAAAPHELLLRFVKDPAPVEGRPVTLGASLIDRVADAGVLITVYPGLVKAQLADLRDSAGLGLGRVIAHEIGHMLLGTREHARRGLMRAVWVTQDGQPNFLSNWRFLPDEGRQMRNRLGSLHVATDTAQPVAAERNDQPRPGTW